MRIVSLLPSATEMVYALGLGEQLVGVSHTCDFPPEARTKPVVSRGIREISGFSSAEIDAYIQQARKAGNPVHWIDGDLLRRLRPDIILTQEICEICAIGSGSVYETAHKVLDYQPTVVVVRPASLADIYQNLRNIAAAAGIPERAEALISHLQARVAYVRERLPAEAEPPRVFCVDWLEPLRNTGQWVPELVELAGGRDGLAEKWGKSREIPWDEAVAYRPDYLMLMPCAFSPERVRSDSLAALRKLPGWDGLPAVRKGQVFLFDGRIPSRHGPRVVDVMEGLAEAMWPERFAGLAKPGVFERTEQPGAKK